MGHRLPNASEEVMFGQDEIPDGEEAGIASLVFQFETMGDNVRIGAYMNPDDEVIDADEGDFPQFDCTLTVDQFKRLLKAAHRFDLFISNHGRLK